MARFVKDRDRGYRQLLANVGATRGGPVVNVGIQGSEASAPKRGPHEEGEPYSLVEIAALHEFGIGVPEHSFIRAWVDENRAMIETTLAKAAQLVVSGKMELDRALELVGAKFQSSIQERIANGIAPALTASTIAAKGSSTPLIDTGQLRSAISYLVAKRAA